MRILLVGPDQEENLSVRYLSASLLCAGHDTELATFNSAADIAAVAEAAEGAEIVGLSMCFQSRASEFFRLAQLIKSQDARKLIVAGGHYASCAAEPLLTNHPEIDIIVIHEGESALAEIAEGLLQLQERLPQIAGVAYRNSQGQVCFTTPRQMPDNLDVLPFPDRRGPIRLIAGIPTSYLMGSRGCYGRCAYCCITTLHGLAPGKRFRQRSIENIAEEMAKLYHERGTRQFVFHDDNFLVPPRAMNHARLSALEKALNNRGFERIALVIKCRPADADEEVLRRLRDLGLVRVFLGIESATERGLSALQRKQTVQESEQALETCAELGISAQFTIMAFHPDATAETLRADVAFMRRFSSNPLNFCRAEIYAGTPLEKQMIALGRARGNYLAREYSVVDPIADRACNMALNLFCERCWRSSSLMQNAIGLDHSVAVVRRFYDRPGQSAFCARAARWLKSVNLDTIDLLEEVIQLSERDSGARDAGIQRALLVLKKREARSREEFLREASKLRVQLGELCSPGEASEAVHFPGPRLKVAKQVAAALLVLGIPAASGCRHAGPENGPAAPTKVGSEATGAPGPNTGQEKVTGSLLGRVTDSSGAPIRNVRIKITRIDTGEVRSLTTDKTGRYGADDLPVGAYNVRAKAEGFADAEKTGLALRAGERVRADFVLQFNYGCCEYAPVPLEPPRVTETPRPLPPPIIEAPKPEPPPIDDRSPRTPPPLPPAQEEKQKYSLAGTVKDASGAVIPGVSITVSGKDTGTVRTLTTNEFGHFQASDLPAGNYSVAASMQGFRTMEYVGIALPAKDGREVDIVLAMEVGVCETVAVPLRSTPEDLELKKKPFTYSVGDNAKDHATLQGIAKLVYGDSKKWVQIFEANRSVIQKPSERIPNGTPILIPESKRNMPKLEQKVMPVYPDAAKQQHIWGDLVLDVTLKDDGTAERVDVVEGPPLLVEAATNAVKQWHYRSSSMKGKPNKFVVAISFTKQGKVRAQ
jgi:radical SAM superfamily enzyme YgiQ (UPF0313 family)